MSAKVLVTVEPVRGWKLTVMVTSSFLRLASRDAAVRPMRIGNVTVPAAVAVPCALP